jgi:hypothetical protein
MAREFGPSQYIIHSTVKDLNRYTNGLRTIVKIYFYGVYVEKVTGIRPFKIATMSLKITYESTDISPPVTSEL